MGGRSSRDQRPSRGLVLALTIVLAASLTLLSAHGVRAGTDILRESYAPASWDTSFANIFGGQVVAQSFVAHSSFLLTHLELYVFDQPQSSSTDILQVLIAADAGGQPGAVLASAAQQGPQNWSWVAFGFYPWVPLNVTQRYWIIASDSEPRPKGYEWAMNAPGDYPYGEAEWSSSLNGGWANQTGADLFFKVYGISGPALSLEMEPRSLPVNAGAIVPLDLWFNNSGNEAAGTVGLSVSLDANLTYLGDDASTSGGVATGTLSWTFTGVGAGLHRMTVWVQVDPSVRYYDGQSLAASARLNYTDTSGVPQVPLGASASVTVLEPVVRCTATPSPPQVSPGQSFNYTVSLLNLGSGRAGEVWINASAAARIVLLGDDAVSAGGVAVAPFAWRFSNVSAQSYAFNVSARADPTAWPGDRLALRLNVTYTDAVGHVVGTFPSVSEASIHGPSVVVALSQDEPDPRPGDTIHLTLYANNTGDATASRLWINASLPSWTSVDDATPTPVSTPGGSLDFLMQEVAPGPLAATVTLSVSGDAPPGGWLNTSVHLDVADRNGTLLRPSQASFASLVISPRFQVTLLTTSGAVVHAGDRIDLVLGLDNTGNEVARKVWVNLTLPADTLLVNSSLPWALTNGTTYAWTLTDLAPGPHRIGARIEVSARVADREPLVGSLAVAYERGDGALFSAATATIQFQASASTAGGSLEALLMWAAILAAIFLLFLLLSYLDVLPRRRSGIDDVFLLHNSGVLICHYSTTLHPDVDSDIASGMLVAVRNFVADALKSKNGALQELRYGDYHIHMAQGRYAILVVFTRGPRSRNLDLRMQTVLRNIETLYGKVLEAWSGRPEDFKGVEEVLLKLVEP